MTDEKTPIRMYEFVLNSLVGTTYENLDGEKVLITGYQHNTPIGTSMLTGGNPNSCSISLNDLLENCVIVSKEDLRSSMPKRISTHGAQPNME